MKPFQGAFNINKKFNLWLEKGKQKCSEYLLLHDIQRLSVPLKSVSR